MAQNIRRAYWITRIAFLVLILLPFLLSSGFFQERAVLNESGIVADYFEASNGVELRLKNKMNNGLLEQTDKSLKTLFEDVSRLKKLQASRPLLETLPPQNFFSNMESEPFLFYSKFSHQGCGCWRPQGDFNTQTLTVDLGSKHWISQIDIAGRGCFNEFVRSYKIFIRNDSSETWTLLKRVGQDDGIFPGPEQEHQTRPNLLFDPFVARYVQILPTSYNNVPSLRWELYGYKLEE